MLATQPPAGQSPPASTSVSSRGTEGPADIVLADLIDDAVLGVTAKGALLAANRAAHRLLEAREGIEMIGGLPLPVDTRLRLLWPEALREAAAGRRRLLWSRDEQGRSISLQPGPAAVPVVVRVGDDPNGRLRRLWAYAHATGLSAQETRVLEALVEGEDPATIAGRHQVAMATVRSQIRGVLAKAGVNGMRELLAQVMRVLR